MLNRYLFSTKSIFLKQSRFNQDLYFSKLNPYILWALPLQVFWKRTQNEFNWLENVPSIKLLVRTASSESCKCGAALVFCRT